MSIAKRGHAGAALRACRGLRDAGDAGGRELPHAVPANGDRRGSAARPVGRSYAQGTGRPAVPVPGQGLQSRGSRGDSGVSRPRRAHVRIRRQRDGASGGGLRGRQGRAGPRLERHQPGGLQHLRGDAGASGQRPDRDGRLLSPWQRHGNRAPAQRAPTTMSNSNHCIVQMANDGFARWRNSCTYTVKMAYCRPLECRAPRAYYPDTRTMPPNGTVRDDGKGVQTALADSPELSRSTLMGGTGRAVAAAYRGRFVTAETIPPLPVGARARKGLRSPSNAFNSGCRVRGCPAS